MCTCVDLEYCPYGYHFILGVWTLVQCGYCPYEVTTNVHFILGVWTLVQCGYCPYGCNEVMCSVHRNCILEMVRHSGYT